MGNVLDGILKKTIEDSFTVNVDYISERFDIDNREQDFSIQINYSDGVGVDMIFYLEGSIDGENFSEITNSRQPVSDPSGTHIWDISGSGVVWFRVGIIVNAGSINLNKILYSGKRRH